MWPFIVLAELTQSALFLPVLFVDLSAWYGVLPPYPIVIIH